MIRFGSTLLLLLLLTTSAFAAGPFVGPEERIETLSGALDLTLVRSADATLLAWIEGSSVRARVDGTTMTLGTGNDVRAATDGKDFQIVWVDQSRIVGARMSNPSEVKTLVNLFAYFNGTTVQYPQAFALVWNGKVFQIFAGLDAADTAAALNGVVLSGMATSALAHQVCTRTFGFPFFYCIDVPTSYRLDWRLRPDNAEMKTFSLRQDGYMSSHRPMLVAGANEFLLVWKSSTSIDAIRLRPDGSIAGFINVPIAKSLTGKRGPQVAWDGTRYLIVFDVVEASGDIYGAVVTPGPTYVAEPFLIAGGAENELAPAVTAIGPDRFLVAYTLGNEGVGTREVSFKEPLPSRRRVAR